MSEITETVSDSPALRLLVESEQEPSFELELDAPWLVVAGYTGRDPALVDEHIRELQLHGVSPPPLVPMVWVLPTWLLQLAGGRVEIDGGATSGEVEPVLIRLPDGRLFVGVGSDHTDRDRERESWFLSKLGCPKIISRSVWPYHEVESVWDQLRLTSWCGTTDPYQDGSLQHIRKPAEILDFVESSLELSHDRPLVVFLGTVPLQSSTLAFDSEFTATLFNPQTDRALTCRYRVEEICQPINSGAHAPSSSVARPKPQHRLQEEEESR